ncbi:hypothetical protein BESB_013630 [Besnoitia besnoiti]|uniref:Transmembrane protein n=1 Tax=Besnoitia besnoiti TaxID=94643 RepID=A0A2A9M8V0_BESBE|nr:hypothetical protein BESB_013630 [Besnoitia besnoiti]PFH32751.1 hypothetical protein BESB_013630 [Besnoitia besnoiti]
MERPRPRGKPERLGPSAACTALLFGVFYLTAAAGVEGGEPSPDLAGLSSSSVLPGEGEKRKWQLRVSNAEASRVHSDGFEGWLDRLDEASSLQALPHATVTSFGNGAGGKAERLFSEATASSALPAERALTQRPGLTAAFEAETEEQRAAVADGADENQYRTIEGANSQRLGSAIDTSSKARAPLAEGEHAEAGSHDTRHEEEGLSGVQQEHSPESEEDTEDARPDAAATRQHSAPRHAELTESDDDFSPETHTAALLPHRAPTEDLNREEKTKQKEGSPAKKTSVEPPSAQQQNVASDRESGDPEGDRVIEERQVRGHPHRAEAPATASLPPQHGEAEGGLTHDSSNASRDETTLARPLHAAESPDPARAVQATPPSSSIAAGTEGEAPDPLRGRGQESSPPGGPIAGEPRTQNTEDPAASREKDEYRSKKTPQNFSPLEADSEQINEAQDAQERGGAIEQETFESLHITLEDVVEELPREAASAETRGNTTEIHPAPTADVSGPPPASEFDSEESRDSVRAADLSSSTQNNGRTRDQAAHEHTQPLVLQRGPEGTAAASHAGETVDSESVNEIEEHEEAPNSAPQVAGRIYSSDEFGGTEMTDADGNEPLWNGDRTSTSVSHDIKNTGETKAAALAATEVAVLEAERTNVRKERTQDGEAVTDRGGHSYGEHRQKTAGSADRDEEYSRQNVQSHNPGEPLDQDVEEAWRDRAEKGTPKSVEEAVGQWKPPAGDDERSEERADSETPSREAGEGEDKSSAEEEKHAAILNAAEDPSGLSDSKARWSAVRATSEGREPDFGSQDGSHSSEGTGDDAATKGEKQRRDDERNIQTEATTVYHQLESMINDELVTYPSPSDTPSASTEVAVVDAFALESESLLGGVDASQASLAVELPSLDPETAEDAAATRRGAGECLSQESDPEASADSQLPPSPPALEPDALSPPSAAAAVQEEETEGEWPVAAGDASEDFQLSQEAFSPRRHPEVEPPVALHDREAADQEFLETAEESAEAVSDRTLQRTGAQEANSESHADGARRPEAEGTAAQHASHSPAEGTLHEAELDAVDVEEEAPGRVDQLQKSDPRAISSEISSAPRGDPKEDQQTPEGGVAIYEGRTPETGEDLARRVAAGESAKDSESLQTSDQTEPAAVASQNAAEASASSLASVGPNPPTLAAAAEQGPRKAGEYLPQRETTEPYGSISAEGGAPHLASSEPQALQTPAASSAEVPLESSPEGSAPAAAELTSRTPAPPPFKRPEAVVHETNQPGHEPFGGPAHAVLLSQTHVHPASSPGLQLVPALLQVSPGDPPSAEASLALPPSRAVSGAAPVSLEALAEAAEGDEAAAPVADGGAEPRVHVQALQIADTPPAPPSRMDAASRTLLPSEAPAAHAETLVSTIAGMAGPSAGASGWNLPLVVASADVTHQAVAGDRESSAETATESDLPPPEVAAPPPASAASGPPAETGARETWATLDAAVSGVDIITIPDNFADLIRNPGVQPHRPMSVPQPTSAKNSSTDTTPKKAKSAPKKVFDPSLLQNPTMFDQFMEQEAAEGITPGEDLTAAPLAAVDVPESSVASQPPNLPPEGIPPQDDGGEDGDPNGDEDEEDDEDDEEEEPEEEEPEPRRTYPVALPLPMPISFPWIGNLMGGGLGALSVRGPPSAQSDAFAVPPVDPAAHLGVGSGVPPNLAPPIPLKVEEGIVSSMAPATALPSLRASSAATAPASPLMGSPYPPSPPAGAFLARPTGPAPVSAPGYGLQPPDAFLAQAGAHGPGASAAVPIVGVPGGSASLQSFTHAGVAGAAAPGAQAQPSHAAFPSGAPPMPGSHRLANPAPAGGNGAPASGIGVRPLVAGGEGGSGSFSGLPAVRDPAAAATATSIRLPKLNALPSGSPPFEGLPGMRNPPPGWDLAAPGQHALSESSSAIPAYASPLHSLSPYPAVQPNPSSPFASSTLGAPISGGPSPPTPAIPTPATAASQFMRAPTSSSASTVATGASPAASRGYAGSLGPSSSSTGLTSLVYSSTSSSAFDGSSGTDQAARGGAANSAAASAARAASPARVGPSLPSSAMTAGSGIKTHESAGSGGLAAAGSAAASVARQLPGATAAMPAIVQSADQLFTSTSSFVGVGNTLVKSFPFEEAIEWSQQVNDARRQKKGQPPAHLGEPWVRCVSSGMTCCVPQKAVGGDWKKRPPYLNDSPADSRACQAHFVPMQNAVCASTAYEDNECGIQRMETSQFVLFRHVLNIRGSKSLKAICQCRWELRPDSTPAVDGRTAVLAGIDDQKSHSERGVAPAGTPIEGFASWQFSKKAIAEKQQKREKTSKMAQGVGAALKATALLTQQGSDAMHSSLAGMERAAGDPVAQVQEIRGGVEAIADLLMKTGETTSAMSMVAKALDDLAYIQKK